MRITIEFKLKMPEKHDSGQFKLMELCEIYNISKDKIQHISGYSVKDGEFTRTNTYTIFVYIINDKKCILINDKGDSALLNSLTF